MGKDTELGSRDDDVLELTPAEEVRDETPQDDDVLELTPAEEVRDETPPPTPLADLVEAGVLDIDIADLDISSLLADEDIGEEGGRPGI